jgi:hypothetical protein
MTLIASWPMKGTVSGCTAPGAFMRTIPPFSTLMRSCQIDLRFNGGHAGLVDRTRCCRTRRASTGSWRAGDPRSACAGKSG